MESSRASFRQFIIFFLCITSCCAAARLSCPRYHNKYYYDPYQDEALLSEGEGMCALSTATLRTILRGLVAVLTKIFPECSPFDGPCCHQKKEEPIKIFRQIMACPSMPMPYYPPPPCTAPRTQIPPPPTIPTTFMHTHV